jgi:hypothetical protein
MMAFNWGVPNRMAKAMYKVFMRDGQAKHQSKVDLIDRLLLDEDRIPLADSQGVALGEPAIWHAADAAARDVYALCNSLQTADAILAAVGALCARRGIAPPKGETEQEQMARALDKAWWRRHLGTEWRRRFEHTSIQLGLTHQLAGDPYVSREMALMQELQNRANQKLLESRTATNENGQTFTVAELAACGTGNKTVRRNELMTRIRGFEEVAQDRGDIGMFWTITCPSKYHSVGGTNAKYNGATPREAQHYLVHVFALMRAAWQRAGIRPYGFRIAEPHTDGCPHWHILFFVDPKRATDLEMIITAYAMQEDEDEAGAQKNRVKLVNIEAGKGTAAGYIIKYVCKNIDGFGVGDHKSFENGQTYVVVSDNFGDVEIVPSARVTYWSQVWGIRQFQQIGGAPVGVWRELRRIKADAVAAAPDCIRAAHLAVQAIKSDDPAVAKQADWAAYLMAQGGPAVARKDLAVRLEGQAVTIKGRYVTSEVKKPVGVYAAAFPNEVYESVRYRWTITGPGESSGVAFDLPRTGVNNCTPATDAAWMDPANAPGSYRKNFVREGWASHENRGDGQGGQRWSKGDDVIRVDQFKKRTVRGAASHLEQLKRKYEQ